MSKCQIVLFRRGPDWCAKNHIGAQICSQLEILVISGTTSSVIYWNELLSRFIFCDWENQCLNEIEIWIQTSNLWMLLTFATNPHVIVCFESKSNIELLNCTPWSIPKSWSRDKAASARVKYLSNSKKISLKSERLHRELTNYTNNFLNELSLFLYRNSSSWCVWTKWNVLDSLEYLMIRL